MKRQKINHCSMHNFRELKVWQNGMKLAKEIFVLSKDFPAEERYGLTTQIRRCAVSIPSNIAGGSSRSSWREFARFIDIAIGSCYEMETQLLLGIAFGYVGDDQSNRVIDDIRTIQKMLHRLKTTIIKE